MTWIKGKISDICAVGDGSHASIKRREKGVLYLTSKNFKHGGLDLSNVDYISEEDFKTHFKEKGDAVIKPKENDVLFSIIGSLGSPYLMKSGDELGLSSSVSIIRPDLSKISPQFLLYWIRSAHFQKSIHQIKSGVAQSFLSLGMIRELPLEYPFEIPIQQKIAAILSAYDDLIENNLRRIRLSEEAAQHLYREWFVRFRFPGWEEVRFLDGLPEGWEKAQINSICDLVGGFAFKSNEYSGSGAYKIVTIKNVGDRFFDNSKFDRIESIPEKMKGHCNIREGDILLSLTGNVGRTCLAFGENLLLNQRVSIINPKIDRYKSFLYCLFGSEELVRVMQNLSSGVAQQNLSPVKLGFHQIIEPKEKILNEFSEVTSPMLNQILILNKQNQKLKEARDILLPRLMNQTIEV